MSNLPADLQARVDAVKAQIDLVALIGRVVKLRRTGRDQTGLCPFHDEKTGSFTVVPEKRFYHCFGCGAHGDALRFVQDHRGLSFADALRELEADAGLAAAPRQLPGGGPLRRDSLRRDEADDGVVSSMEAALEVWKAGRRPHGTIVETYLRHRGIDPYASAVLDVVRFHARCPASLWRRGSSPSLTAPAMLAPICRIEGAIGARAIVQQGVHVTFLAPDGRGKAKLPSWRDRDGKEHKRASRKIWGEAALGCVPLPGRDWLTSWRDAAWLDLNRLLIVGEGLESTLSLVQREGKVPPCRGALATLSLGNLQGHWIEDGPKVDGSPSLTLWNVRCDPERAPVTFRDAGAVLIGVDNDMAGLSNRRVQTRPKGTLGLVSGTEEYERSGYVKATFDADYRVLDGTMKTPPGASAVIATGLSAAGTPVTFLDPSEYDRSGYGQAVVDADFRVLSPAAPVAAAASPNVDKLYDLVDLSDGTNSQTYSVTRATGKLAKLSPAGSNHTAVGVRSDGYAVYKSDRTAGPPGGLFARDLKATTSEIALVPYHKIVEQGDSLTFVGGVTANTPWKKLGDMLGWPAVGFGVNGQNARQTAARMGARPFYVTLTGNSLPASGAVALTAITENPITPGLPNLKIHGRVGLNGPFATLTKSSDDLTYSLTQDGGGSVMAIAPSTRFYPDGAGTSAIVPYQNDGLLIVWAARNNYHETDSIIENTALMIAQQSTLTKRFIVPLCLYGEGDEIGTTSRAVIDFTNNAIKARWPDNWVDFNGSLQAAGDGSAGDIADVAAGITPRSLRLKDSDGVTIDFLHPNAAGNAVEAAALYTFITNKGWNL